MTLPAQVNWFCLKVTIAVKEIKIVQPEETEERTTLTTMSALKVGQSFRPKITLKQQAIQPSNRGSNWQASSLAGPRPFRNFNISVSFGLPPMTIFISSLSCACIKKLRKIMGMAIARLTLRTRTKTGCLSLQRTFSLLWSYTERMWTKIILKKY